MRDKRQKFVVLVEKRVNRLIKEIRLVANLSNRSNYQYKDEDVRKIFAAIDAEIRDAKKRFDRNGSGETTRFML